MKMSFRHCLLASAVVVSSLGFTASTQAALPFFSDKKDEVPSLAPMLEQKIGSIKSHEQMQASLASRANRQ